MKANGIPNSKYEPTVGKNSSQMNQLFWALKQEITCIYIRSSSEILKYYFFFQNSYHTSFSCSTSQMSCASVHRDTSGKRERMQRLLSREQHYIYNIHMGCQNQVSGHVAPGVGIPIPDVINKMATSY